MNWELILFAGVFLMVSSCGLWAVVTLDRSRAQWRRRISLALQVPANDSGPARPTTKRRKDMRTARATLSAEDTLLGLLESRLNEVGLRISPSELVVMGSIFGSALFSAVFFLLGMTPFLALPIAVAGTVLSVRVLFDVARAQRLRRFTENLPEALDVFARGLRAGRPVSDSITLTASNSPSPLREEFSFCRDQLGLGIDMATTFRNQSERVPTAEVQFFAVATALQSETGGNLIETIDGLTEQLRERRKLRKKIKALSAEVRVSAAILAGLPFAVGLIILFLSPTYLSPLFNDLRGQIMLGLGIMSIVLGVYIMFRMARIDV
jgi:tight adherence protein B